MAELFVECTDGVCIIKKPLLRVNGTSLHNTEEDDVLNGGLPNTNLTPFYGSDLLPPSPRPDVATGAIGASNPPRFLAFNQHMQDVIDVSGHSTSTSTQLQTSLPAPFTLPPPPRHLLDLLDELLMMIFSYVPDSSFPSILRMNKRIFRLLHPRWRKIYECSATLQWQRRLYYYRKANSLCVFYSSAEKALAKKFVGFNSKLGISAYSYVSAGINLSVRVRPAAMGHVVGSRYTWTKWRTQDTAHGWWVENNPENEEIWRINISYDSEVCEELWFSVFVRDSLGNESWDSNEGWNYALNVSSIPTHAYDVDHLAIQQHEQTKKVKTTTTTVTTTTLEGRNDEDMAEDEDDDFVEEVWFNVNQAMCS